MMRVLLGPRHEPVDGSVAADTARILAGEDGVVVSLRDAGVRDLSRPLSRAEVAWLREALVGREAFRGRSWKSGDKAESEDAPLVGYVCDGVRPGLVREDTVARDSAEAISVVAVTDHLNLTWRSPLIGPNDDSVGPRFPGMAKIYYPEAVGGRLSARHGIIVEPGVVAGVGRDELLDAHETEAIRVSRCPAASSELVPAAIVAAHMGLRIAAAVVTTGTSPEEEMGSGRS